MKLKLWERIAVGTRTRMLSTDEKRIVTKLIADVGPDELASVLHWIAVRKLSGERACSLARGIIETCDPPVPCGHELKRAGLIAHVEVSSAPTWTCEKSLGHLGRHLYTVSAED